jgi:hypothetical protein
MSLSAGYMSARKCEDFVKDSTFEYVNGKWFDGCCFEPRTGYARSGMFVPSLNHEEPRTVIDLGGRFIVPPMSDAHSHYPEQNFSFANQAFLSKGMYYVLNANNFASYGNVARELSFTPKSIDAVFAHGGFTCPDGHPMSLYHRLIDMGVYPLSKDALEGAAYYTVNSLSDVSEKWPMFLSTRPDLVKVYVVDICHNTSVRGKGLSRKCLTALIMRARAAGLRVAAHIETAEDFHHCVTAGVNLIMHLPGYRLLKDRQTADFVISDSDARLAATRGVSVVTTAALLDVTRFPPLLAVQQENLNLLKGCGVTVALGSDLGPGAGLQKEIMYVRSLGVYSDLEMLRLACQDTGRVIFPQRQIGSLSAGYEASFLALSSNPLEQFEALFRAAMGVKNGYPLLTKTCS